MLAPLVIDDGVAEKLEITGAGELTVTGALPVPLPRGPSHFKVYVVSAVKAGVVNEPLVACAPDGAPTPLVNKHEVLLFAAQLMVVVTPLAIEDGDALIETDGGLVTTETVNTWLAVAVGLLTEPLHVIVNVVVLVKFAEYDPFKLVLKVVPPWSFKVQLPASVEDQLSMVVCPGPITDGVAVSVTVGVKGGGDASPPPHEAKPKVTNNNRCKSTNLLSPLAVPQLDMFLPIYSPFLRSYIYAIFHSKAIPGKFVSKMERY